MDLPEKLTKHFQEDAENFKKIDVFLAKQEVHNEVNGHILKDIQNDLKEVVIQTKKTNGRVSTLESSKAYLAGAMAVIITFLLPVVFILISNFLKK